MCNLSVLAICSLLASLRNEWRIQNYYFISFSCRISSWGSITFCDLSTHFHEIWAAEGEQQHLRSRLEEEEKLHQIGGRKKLAIEVGRRKWSFIWKKTTYNGCWRRSGCCNSMVTFLQKLFDVKKSTILLIDKLLHRNFIDKSIHPSYSSPDQQYTKENFRWQIHPRMSCRTFCLLWWRYLMFGLNCCTFRKSKYNFIFFIF